MMESCYVPNNPHYGLQVEPGATTPSPYWSTDDMGSFSLPALDLDPLPSLFPFSPCAATTYKSELPPLKEKQPHDMADVLLSLKHAVVHPGQTGGQLSPTFQAYSSAQQCGGAAGYQGPSASLSYTVHPHQMVSPGGTYTTQYCTASQDQTMFGGTAVPQAQHHNMFPSMSVNVSMNMTMHGYPDNLQHQVTCPQTDFYCPASLPNVNFSSRSGNAMADRGGTIFGRPKKLTDLEMQWTPAPPNPSPVYPQSQGLLSPQAYTGGATYSFTADFRPSGMPAEPALLPSNAAFNSSFKPVISKVVAPPSRSGTGRRYPTNKLAAVMQQPQQVVEEVQRPNLCRICGKTYARPSTLKTHLRTHSGEKPYRCRDCNKSFSQAANLTAHVRTHSGEKPFRCPICDRRFSQSSSVTTHMRTHSGERPYRCRLCKKAFSDSSTLTKHLRIHSGEKPYQCKLCLLRFSQSGNLNRHMRVHGGQGGAA